MNIPGLEIVLQYLQNQPISKAWVFGSFSRGEETSDSDIDIMIALIPGSKVGLFKFNQIKKDLQNLTGKKVDLVTETSLLPFAKASALSDRKLIYERASFNSLGRNRRITTYNCT